MTRWLLVFLLAASYADAQQYANYPVTGGGGSGTVNSITAGTGLSGGTITTSGTISLTTPVAVANGGTGAASASAALTSLGAAASGANADITTLSATNEIDVNDGNGNQIILVSPNLTGLGGTYTLTLPPKPSQNGQPLISSPGGTGWGTPISSYDTIVNRNLEIDSLAGKTIATWVCDTNISLSGTQTCDGVSIAPPSPPVLVIGETDATLNGLYCAAAGAWTRCGHMPDNAFTAAGAIVTVATGGGTNYDQTVWYVNGDGTGALHAYQIPVTHGTRRPYSDAGSCTVASTTLSTTPANLTCTGVPASTAVSVTCSGSAAFSTPTGDALYCRATGTANQIACDTAALNTQAMTFACSWVKP